MLIFLQVSAMSWRENQLAVAFTDGSVRVLEVGGIHSQDLSLTKKHALAPDMVYPLHMEWLGASLFVVKGHAIFRLSGTVRIVSK